MKSFLLFVDNKFTIFVYLLVSDFLVYFIVEIFIKKRRWGSKSAGALHVGINI